MRKPSSSAPSPVRSPDTVYIDGRPYVTRGPIVRPYYAPPVRLSGTVSPEIAPTTGPHECSERFGAMPASGSYFFPMRRGA